MTDTKFDEGNSYLVRRLHTIDPDGNRAVVRDVAVVFTPGWIFVQESTSDGYVLPRGLVLLVEGLKRVELH